MPVNRLELLRKSPADLVTYKMVMMDLKILASYFLLYVVNYLYRGLYFGLEGEYAGDEGL